MESGRLIEELEEIQKIQKKKIGRIWWQIKFILILDIYSLGVYEIFKWKMEMLRQVDKRNLRKKKVWFEYVDLVIIDI